MSAISLQSIKLPQSIDKLQQWSDEVDGVLVNTRMAMAETRSDLEQASSNVTKRRLQIALDWYTKILTRCENERAAIDGLYEKWHKREKRDG